MKLTLTLAAALIGGVAMPGLLLAGTTEDITGCATVSDPATNFTTFADPTCYRAPEGGSGIDGQFLAVIADLLTPDEDE
jgi:hypothetical protein